MKIFFAILGIIVGIFLLIAGATAFNAWLLMLAWGAIALHFGWQTIGFWLTVIIVLVLQFVIGGLFGWVKN